MTRRDDDLRVKLGRIGNRGRPGRNKAFFAEVRGGAKNKDIVPHVWQARNHGHEGLRLAVEAGEPAPPQGWPPA